MPTNESTIGSWLVWWFDNVASGELDSKNRDKYRSFLTSAIAKSSIVNTPLVNATSANIYSFYFRDLKRQLPRVWAKRIYRFARYAMLSAARVGLARNYPKGTDFWMIWHRFARALTVFASVIGVLLSVLTIFAGIRVVRDKEDWLTAGATVARENGLGVVVAALEDIYFGYIKVPVVGGTPTDGATFGADGETPAASPATSASVAFVSEWGPALTPSEVPPVVMSPVTPLKDEGQWLPTLIKVNGSTAIRVARVRPDSLHTSYFATITWLDPKLLAFMQVPGTEIPEGNFDHGTGQVPKKLAAHYVAGLDDGFLMRDSQGGYILNGKVIKSMVSGKATLVTYTDGTIDVLKWGRDPVRKPIQAARQNLQLTVDGGQSQVHDETQSKWGWVWQGIGSGKNLVWRSGLGVRADGSVVFVIGDALSAKTLSDLLVRAGSVRALPLDMNSAYANGFLYGPYKGGLRLDPSIYRQPDRFLAPSERDFVAVFAKSPAEAQVTN